MKAPWTHLFHRPIAGCPGLAVMLALGLLTLTSAQADSCTLVNRDTAERAVAALDAVEHVLYEDWSNSLAVRGARWTRSGFLYQVEINEGKVLDLSVVYVPVGDGVHFDNLGAKLGCGSGGGPKRITGELFSDGPVPGFTPGEDSWQPPRALLGLLELPELERAWYGSAQQTAPTPVTVYEQPSRDAAVLGQVAAMTDVPYLEYGYERPGAIVLERRTTWYRIALASGSGWVAAEDAGPLHEVASLMTENLAYLTVGWDGRLYSTPDPSGKARWLRPAWRRQLGGEVSVNVTESRAAAGILWLRVELLRSSPCGGDDPSVLASGWVPAHNDGNTMNAWFSSRGC